MVRGQVIYNIHVDTPHSGPKREYLNQLSEAGLKIKERALFFLEFVCAYLRHVQDVLNQEIQYFLAGEHDFVCFLMPLLNLFQLFFELSDVLYFVILHQVQYFCVLGLLYFYLGLN